MRLTHPSLGDVFARLKALSVYFPSASPSPGFILTLVRIASFSRVYAYLEALACSPPIVPTPRFKVSSLPQHLLARIHWPVRPLGQRRQWQPTPVFLPGESQGQRSLAGCRLWGRTESDTTEATQQQQLNRESLDSEGEGVPLPGCKAAASTTDLHQPVRPPATPLRDRTWRVA